jgi:DNA-binding GntR family transcriptional regulator
LTALAYERIRADLLSCRLRPGARLIISSLCANLDLSLGSVREALAKLSSEGLVVGEPRKGFRAAPVSTTDLLDLSNVRTHVEQLCLDRAIAHGDLAWEGRLLASYHEMKRIAERSVNDDPIRLSEGWATAHKGFHHALVSACDSDWLLSLRENLYTQSERYRRLSVALGTRRRNVDREHKELMEAVLARDATLAKELMRQHIARTAQVLLDADLSAAVSLTDKTRKFG